MALGLINFIRKIRTFYLIKFKWKRYSFGRNPYFGRMVYLWAKNNIVIGNDFYIGKFSQIECDAIIGNHVILANHVALVGRYDHHYQQVGVPMRLASRIRDKDYSWKGMNNSIVIENDVWIGYGSIILSGVKIGRGSIVAAGSVVTKDIDEYSIYGGVPARKLRERFANLNDKIEHEKLYKLNYNI